MSLIKLHLAREMLSHLVAGLTSTKHTQGAKRANAMETSKGRRTTGAESEFPSRPKFAMTCTSTNPITSSMIAALDSTTPSREVVRPLVPSTVNVVPRLVDDSDAPAAKHCKYVAQVSCLSTKDSPMGKLMPVKATATEIDRLAFTAFNEVDKPPVIRENKTQYAEKGGQRTFVYKQQQAEVPELYDGSFNIR